MIHLIGTIVVFIIGAYVALIALSLAIRLLSGVFGEYPSKGRYDDKLRQYMAKEKRRIYREELIAKKEAVKAKRVSIMRAIKEKRNSDRATQSNNFVIMCLYLIHNKKNGVK